MKYLNNLFLAILCISQVAMNFKIEAMETPGSFMEDEDVTMRAVVAAHAAGKKYLRIENNDKWPWVVYINAAKGGELFHEELNPRGTCFKGKEKNVSSVEVLLPVTDCIFKVLQRHARQCFSVWVPAKVLMDAYSLSVCRSYMTFYGKPLMQKSYESKLAEALAEDSDLALSIEFVDGNVHFLDTVPDTVVAKYDLSKLNVAEHDLSKLMRDVVKQK
jgi:hypothetical protein